MTEELNKIEYVKLPNLSLLDSLAEKTETMAKIELEHTDYDISTNEFIDILMRLKIRMKNELRTRN
jgi:hypothetical protein